MSNYLNGVSCYLVGPVEFDKDSGKDWRYTFINKANHLNLKIFNPLDRPDWMSKIKDYILPNMSRDEIFKNVNNGSEYISKCQSVARKMCLRYLDSSDFVIAYLADTKTYGTTEELVKASEAGKPILCFPKSVPSTWMYDILKDKMFFNNIDEIINYLNSINNGFESIDALEWIFINDSYIYKTL